jgi:hypothetical protein
MFSFFYYSYPAQVIVFFFKGRTNGTVLGIRYENFTGSGSEILISPDSRRKILPLLVHIKK